MAKRTKSPKRPYWQPTPCPSWCFGNHADDADVEARLHLAEWEARVRMSLYSAETIWHKDAAELSREAYPMEMLVNLEQGYREAVPTISLDPEGGRKEERVTSLRMTVDEAERIARALLKAVKLAKGAAR